MNTQLKIEDYLHLIVGQVFYRGGTPDEVLTGINYIGASQVTLMYADGDEHTFDLENISHKPILWPLSDMTEEEKDKFCKHMGWIDSRGRFYLSSYTIANSAEGAKATLYLLKQGFDLFGLHEAGLCLYKNANNEYY